MTIPPDFLSPPLRVPWRLHLHHAGNGLARIIALGGEPALLAGQVAENLNAAMAALTLELQEAGRAMAARSFDPRQRMFDLPPVGLVDLGTAEGFDLPPGGPEAVQ